MEAKPDAEKGEAILFIGCGHGFAVRGDTFREDASKQADQAEDQCIKWFNGHFRLA